MTIVFLDFDGVIRLCGVVEGQVPAFCPERMAALVAVAQATGARVVITSDWRWDRMGRQPQEFRGYLAPELVAVLHEDAATPYRGVRWREVAAWLREHPEVTGYAILEDREPLFHEAPEEMRQRMLLCTSRHGLTSAHLARIPAVLAGDFESLPPLPEPADEEL